MRSSSSPGSWRRRSWSWWCPRATWRRCGGYQSPGRWPSLKCNNNYLLKLFLGLSFDLQGQKQVEDHTERPQGDNPSSGEVQGGAGECGGLWPHPCPASLQPGETRQVRAPSDVCVRRWCTSPRTPTSSSLSLDISNSTQSQKCSSRCSSCSSLSSSSAGWRLVVSVIIWQPFNFLIQVAAAINHPFGDDEGKYNDLYSVNFSISNYKKSF